MLKNVNEPACMKWWYFPEINEDCYFSVRVFPDNTKMLLAMHPPDEAGQIDDEKDYEVVHIGDPYGVLGEEDLEKIKKFFGVNEFHTDTEPV